MGDFDMILDFERPGPDENVLEYSGDYLARKQPFRIFAEDWYYVKSGEFEGLAMEHYLERMNPGDEPGLHLFEQQFEAHLPNAKGDTLYMQTGRLTPEWKQGDDFYHEIRRKDGTRENDYAFIVAMDTLNRAFPDIPIPIRISGRSGPGGIGSDRQLIVAPSTAVLQLQPPAWARSLEVFGISGRKLYSAPVPSGARLSMPPQLSGQGVFYVKYLRG
jgi:hypothetical protein